MFIPFNHHHRSPWDAPTRSAPQTQAPDASRRAGGGKEAQAQRTRRNWRGIAMVFSKQLGSVGRTVVFFIHLELEPHDGREVVSKWQHSKATFFIP